MSDTGGEWQVARRRKGVSRNLKPLQMSLAHCNEPLDVGKTLKRIRETVAEMRYESFWKEWKEQMLVAASFNQKDTEVSSGQLQETSYPKICPLECVCYGLGTFSTCVSARYQLAVMLLLLDAAKIPLKDCFVYDPAFSSGEKDVLRELGLTVLTDNEEGKRLATRPTLFYLVHCGKALYNNLLWKNWDPKCLPLVAIIGNSFSGMRERMIEREFKRDYGYISQAVTVCEEMQLSCPSHLTDVFSDTALITFNWRNLNSLNQSTWTEPPEPQYQHCSDLEIIQRESLNGERT
ncbi:SRR1-like protein isoform X1 [Syngnathoides biaculeatus]|uniref:SRR1-like protein isoform X1 n=1 Tax=Syngnathoides biaculeatus TaxID=300417 RepID=UPI002ADDD6F7|nr:SRR1-like protein isoform X1 [Syngnathoides biaculeatus]